MPKKQNQSPQVVTTPNTSPALGVLEKLNQAVDDLKSLSQASKGYDAIIEIAKLAMIANVLSHLTKTLFYQLAPSWESII